MSASTVTETPRRVAGRVASWGGGSVDRLRASAAAEVPLPVRVVGWVLGGLAALCVWLVLFGVLLSGLVESHAQHGLYDKLRAEIATGTAPLSDAVADGQPVAMITSGTAHLHNMVISQGTSSDVLESGPGHVPGTPLPGQPGASEVMGRSISFGSPFADITDLAKGDSFTVITGEGGFHYVVEDVRRAGDPLPAVLPVGGSQLTLISSEGDGWRSGWAPTHAVFVDAVLKGKSVPLGAGSAAPSADDGLFSGDTSGLYPLVLWLQLLGASVLAGFWARRRWGQWQSWLVAAPVGLAALWGASVEFWLLLPNLL